MLLCPPVEGCDRVLKVLVDKIVSENERRAKGGDLFHRSDAGVKKRWEFRVFCVVYIEDELA